MRKTWYSSALLCGLLAVAPASFALAQAAQATPAAPAADQPAAAAGNINLDLEGVGAEEAFDQLAKQAGVDMVVQDNQLWANADPILIKVQNGRFWPTFMDMCKQARISINPNWGGDRPRSLRLFGANNGGVDFSKLPMVESQGFLLVPQSAQRSASISYSNPESINSNFFIQLSVFTDPVLNVSQMGQTTVTEAVDENGLSLLLPARSNGGMNFGHNPNSLVQNVGINLGYPPNIGKKIARVKGTLRANAATKTEVIEIESPLTAKVLARQFPDYDLTIQPLKQLSKNEDNPNASAQYQLKISFKVKEREGGGIRRENNRDFWSLINAIALTDAQDHRLNFGGGGGGGSNNNVVEYTASFISAGGNASGPPVKLTWKLPTETKEIRIPFELKDLAIP